MLKPSTGFDRPLLASESAGDSPPLLASGWLPRPPAPHRFAGVTIIAAAKCMQYDVAMKMLQIRDLPEEIYQALLLRAKQEKRSLAQQAVIELSRLSSQARVNRRRLALAAIREEIRNAGYRQLAALPEDLIREDRSR